MNEVQQKCGRTIIIIKRRLRAILYDERETGQLTPSMTRPSPRPAASEYDSRSMLFSVSGPGGRPKHFTHLSPAILCR